MDRFLIGKGVRQGCKVSPCLLNLYAEYIMKMLGWLNHNLESRLLREIAITSGMQMTPPLCQKVKRNWRVSWWKCKRRVMELAGLKFSFQKTKIMAFSPISSWQIDGETKETVTDFIFWGSRTLQMVTAAMKLKDSCSLGKKLWPTWTAY